jgi:hypothetical protein
MTVATFVLTGPQQFVHQGALVRAITVTGDTVTLLDDHKNAAAGHIAELPADHPAVATLVTALTRRNG